MNRGRSHQRRPVPVASEMFVSGAVYATAAAGVSCVGMLRGDGVVSNVDIFIVAAAAFGVVVWTPLRGVARAAEDAPRLTEDAVAPRVLTRDLIRAPAAIAIAVLLAVLGTDGAMTAPVAGMLVGTSVALLGVALRLRRWEQNHSRVILRDPERPWFRNAYDARFVRVLGP